MRRKVVKKNTVVLALTCLMVICLICGCTDVEKTANVVPSGPAGEGSGETIVTTTDATAAIVPVNPTESPVEPATEPATEPSTQPPTVPPTQPPTVPPTVPPTEPPTQPPTEPPTQPPTVPPTEPEQVYTITYSDLAGTTHNNPATYTDVAAAGIILSPPTQREGYTFEGWYLGVTRLDSLDGCSGDITLIAKWHKKPTDGAIVLPDVKF